MSKDLRFRIINESDLSKEASYCFAVLDIRSLKFESGVERLVKLRNPWKHEAWTGEWGPKSKRWTPDLYK